MSYADANAGRSRAVTIAAVATVHAAMGYALISGLAYDVVKRIVDPPMTIY